MQRSNVGLTQWQCRQCLLEVCVRTEPSSGYVLAWAVLRWDPHRPSMGCCETRNSALRRHWELWVICCCSSTLPSRSHIPHLPPATICCAPLWVKACLGQEDWPFLMPGGLLHSPCLMENYSPFVSWGYFPPLVRVSMSNTSPCSVFDPRLLQLYSGRSLGLCPHSTGLQRSAPSFLFAEFSLFLHTDLLDKAQQEDPT